MVADSLRAEFHDTSHASSPLVWFEALDLSHYSTAKTSKLDNYIGRLQQLQLTTPFILAFPYIYEGKVAFFMRLHPSVCSGIHKC